MSYRTLTALSVFVAGAALILTSCSAGVSRRSPGPVHGHEHAPAIKAGPPPHAPAHGYRHKHGDAVLLFERSLDVYVVVDHPGYYFYGSHFYRVNGGTWQASFNVAGPWRNVPDYRLPGKLLHHHYARSDKKKHKKNKHRHR